MAGELVNFDFYIGESNLHFARNEASVTFEAFGLVFPTFSFVFWKSFFFSFFAFALLPIFKYGLS